MTRPDTVCLCGRPKKAQRNMCPACRSNPAVRNKVLYQLQQERWRRQADEAAEAETADLPAIDAVTLVRLERLIDEWGRG